MPAPGAKPKDGDKLGHTPVTHEWTQVPNRLYRGKRPTLPRTRTVTNRDGDERKLKLHDHTRAWWADVSTMPHCVLWTKSDWRFALETAMVADMMYRGDRAAAAELRLRERVLGTTLDARRDLRIRYVDAGAAESSSTRSSGKPGSGAPVTSLTDRRARLTSAT